MSNTYQLTKKIDIDKLISHLVAFSVAENRAMGHGGQILLLTNNNELLKTNHLSEDVAQNIFEKLPINHSYFKNPKPSNPENFAGWKYTYLGCGNHLFMKDWLDDMFYKIIHRSNRPSPYIYTTWLEIAVHLIECKQIAKANRT